MPELKDAQNLDARTAMEKLGFGFGNNLHAAGISRIPICTAKEAIEASTYHPFHLNPIVTCKG